MDGNCYDKSSLRANVKQSRETVITRSDKRRSNRIHIKKYNENNGIATFRYTPLAMTENRLRNKCAMTCAEENILSLGGELERGCNIEDNTILEPLTRISNAHKHSQRTAPSPTMGEGKEESVGNIKENNFIDKVYSLFTTHHSLIYPDTDFSRFTSHFSLRKTAFTLAEVLITLGIIGVVAALTMPALIQNYQRHVVEVRLKKFYSTFNQAILSAEAQYGDKKDWYLDAEGVDLDEDGKPIIESSKIDKWFNQYLSNYIVVVKKEVDSSGRMLYYLPDGSAFQFGVGRNPSLRDIHYYPKNPKKCIGEEEQIRGVCVFCFEYMPISNDEVWRFHYNKGLEPAKYNWDGTVDDLYNNNPRGCAKTDAYSGAYCTALIQYNNWSFPKDYPRRVKY